MTSLHLRLPVHRNDSYAIVIEPGLLKSIPKDLKKLKWGNKACIITDTNVKKIYGEDLQKDLRQNEVQATMLSFQPGENYKNLRTVEKLAEQMIQLGHNRDSYIIALGGGIVGDVAGFVASIFMRGIPFVQIPTTLLAMADSSIGGKTGVDLISGKNLIGSFNQPKKVYIDPQIISTLSKRQIQNGLGEIVKHGLIADQGILRLLKKFPKHAMEGHTTTITKLLIRSCRVKARIVQKDVHENHLRMFLNYGHSIGHAIEHASQYKLPHGQAVSIGMNLENRLAVDRKLLKPKKCEEIENLMKSLGLPTRIPEKIDRAPILRAIRHDKKNSNKGLTLTLLKRIGRPVIVKDISEKEIKAVL